MGRGCLCLGLASPAVVVLVADGGSLAGKLSFRPRTSSSSACLDVFAFCFACSLRSDLTAGDFSALAVWGLAMAALLLDRENGQPGARFRPDLVREE